MKGKHVGDAWPAAYTTGTLLFQPRRLLRERRQRRERKASVEIQCAARMFLAKRLLARAREQQHAVLTMQSVIRVFRAKQLAVRMKAAVVTMQCAVRVFRAKQLAVRMKAAARVILWFLRLACLWKSPIDDHVRTQILPHRRSLLAHYFGSEYTVTKKGRPLKELGDGDRVLALYCVPPIKGSESFKINLFGAAQPETATQRVEPPAVGECPYYFLENHGKHMARGFISGPGPRSNETILVCKDRHGNEAYVTKQWGKLLQVGLVSVTSKQEKKIRLLDGKLVGWKCAVATWPEKLYMKVANPSLLSRRLQGGQVRQGSKVRQGAKFCDPTLLLNH